MRALVGDLRAVTDDLDMGERAVVGHSLGAAAAVFAAVAPVSAVVCVDQTLRWGDFAPLVQARERELRGALPMEAVLAIDHELGLGADEDAMFERRVHEFPPEVVLGVWAAMLTTPPEQLTAISEALLPYLTAPLLSLHGTKPPADYRTWLTGLVPTAVVEVWDGMGHFLHLVDSRRFAAWLADLLR